MAGLPDAETHYPRSHAFVIRFHGDADLRSDRCSGRIERVIDFGIADSFSSLDELLEVIGSRLAKQEPGKP